MSSEDLEEQLEDLLSDLTADLVEFEKYRVFLERLFSLKAGTWVEVAALCDSLSEIKVRLATIEASIAGILRVTWLDYPNSAHGEGYCIILFFLEDILWSNLALYNQQLFLRDQRG